MGFISDQLVEVKKHLPHHVTLVAISKTKPNEDILEAYHAGQTVFGENKVQELVDKFETLPKDIEWHLVGHLQTNKVKYVASFIGLIHSVDSRKLLEETNTSDMSVVRNEFKVLKNIFNQVKKEYFL